MDDQIQPTPTPSTSPVTPMRSSKSAVSALLLCLFLGSLGIHRFYVGKVGTGILMLLTLGGFGIWTLVDTVLIATCNFKDKYGYVLDFNQGTAAAPANGSGGSKTVFKVLGIVFGAILIFVGLVVCIAFFMTSGIVSPVKDQLSALRSGDVVAAYSYTSKDFRNATSLDDFEEFVRAYPALGENKDSTFTSREIKNNEGTIKGTIVSKDGDTSVVVYHLIKEEGEWKILGIIINPQGEGAQSSSSDDTSSSDHSSSSTHHNSADVDSSNSSVELTKTFEDTDSHYTIKYPEDWYYERSNDDEVMFSGKEGTPSWYSTISIQTLAAKSDGGLYNNVSDVVADLKEQLSSLNNMKVLDEGPVKYEQNGQSLVGQYVVYSYVYKGHTIKKAQFIIPSENNKGFYSWVYTSTPDQFKVDLPVAKAMFQSWTLN